jgi:cobalt-precorrin 5A hydrolase
MADRQIVIAAGIGCRAGCSAADIVAAVHEAAAQNGVSVALVHALCSADFKAAEPGLREAALALNKPLRLLSRAALAAEAAGTLTASTHVEREFALPSVAETAALAGALALAGQVDGGRLSAGGGTPARLLSARWIVGGAACALAWLEPGA